MNEHQKQPAKEVVYRQSDGDDPNRSREPGALGPDELDVSSETYRTSPSVAPIAFDLEPIGDEPPTTPEQPVSTFARNILIAIGGSAVAFAVFGIAQIVSLQPPTAPASRAEAIAMGMDLDEPIASANDDVVELFNESVAMSLPPAEAKRVVERANAAARMSLSRPAGEHASSELPGATIGASPAEELASRLKSADEALIDAAAADARLRCMKETELRPRLLIHVSFAADGTVASMDFDGATAYPVGTLHCVEDVFAGLVTSGNPEGVSTYTRRLAGADTLD